MSEHEIALRMLDNDTVSVVCKCMGQRPRSTLANFPVGTPVEELVATHQLHAAAPMLSKTGPKKPTKTEDRNELLQDYRRWLYFIAHQLAPERSQVDDVAQEGYIAMWRAFDSFDPAKGALPAWLTKNARARMVEYLQRGAAFGKPEARGVHTTPASIGAVQGSLEQLLEEGFDVASAQDVVDSVLQAYMQGEVCEALADLTDLQRRYVVLRFWHGLSETEMYARALFPPGTVVRNLWIGQHGARRRLQDRLAHLVPVA